MFFKSAARPSINADAYIAAINRSQGVIEFDLDGKILSANENFLAVTGYTLPEIVGQHHRMFVDSSYANTREYAELWLQLNRGEFIASKLRRIGKGGREIWLQGAYNPLLDANGKPYKVVKFVMDVTAAEAQIRDAQATLAAVERSQGIIEFKLDGTIITANASFLSVVGYSLSEIVGRHHRMFVETSYANSRDYAEFWTRLNRGEFVSATFRRVAKGSRGIWLRATYNPLLDANGRPYGVKKLATDITDIEDERRLFVSQMSAKTEEQARVVSALGVGLRELAGGNVNFRLNDALAREYEQLRSDFNAAITKLDQTLASVIETAGAVGSGAAEIATASDDLSQRTEQQAAAIEETRAALAEITQTVNTTAERSRTASQTVTTARGEAEFSGTVVRQTIAAMREIETSSSQVSQIIGVIDEIAFQTNLLALNAGVEAARAGDAGRGFAVVASEVRALAHRSADAAKEIKNLIVKSSGQVQNGAKLVGETGDALTRIIARVNDISTIVAEIAASAQQQSEGLRQTGIAISQMDQGIQQNAAMVEETTAAANVLSGQAEELNSIMNWFTVGTESTLRRQLERTAPHAFRNPARGKGLSDAAE